MKCNASISVQCNAEEKSHIQKLFATGDKEISKGRAEFKILDSQEEIIFEITAKDAVALRAVMSAITRTLSIYEKAKKI
jgi:tRNA threonylcarbamoyladenosine modification (KEOPS) complex  Pcc1 subunit